MVVDHEIEFEFLTQLLNNNNVDDKEINVDTLMQLIADHRIISPIYSAKAVIKNNSLIERFESAQINNTLKQLELTKILIEVIDLLPNIRLICLKGPVLSQHLFNDPAKRSSRDLDILIEEKSFDFVLNTLKENGFTLKTYFKTPAQKKAILKYYHHVEVIHPETGLIIEIHWRLSPFKLDHFDFDKLYNSSENLTIGTNQVRSLVGNELFYYLCVHGCFHRFFRLQWLWDIFILLKEMDENKMLELIGNSGENKKFVIASIGLCNELFPLHVTDKIKMHINKELRVKSFIKDSILAIRMNYSDGKDKRAEKRLRRMFNVHKVHYFAGGLRGLIASLISRNVRPENWKVFAFPDSVFFLNSLFSRIIWLISRLK